MMVKHHAFVQTWVNREEEELTQRPVPGITLPRSELHAAYGGNRQTGISIAGAAGMIHLFSDPITIARYGLVDGFDQDGVYLYTGAGLRGDQSMTQANRALLTHKEAGRDVFLWHREGKGTYRCIGQFEVDTEQPYLSTDATDVDGDIRTVIVFRLRPVGDTASLDPIVVTIPTAEHQIAEEKAAFGLPVRHTRVIQETGRLERSLISHYHTHLLRRGHTVDDRLLIRPPGEISVIRADLYDQTDNVLIECKPSPTRQAIRMAIGLLLDYRRFIEPKPRLAVLTETKPRQDLIDLCGSLIIEVIWLEEEGAFASSFD